MVNNRLNVGAVVFWSIAEWTDRTRLASALQALDLESLIPDPRPAPAALRAALDEVFRGPRVLIRPLATKDGFTVVHEERGKEANDYQRILSARVNDDPPRLTFEPASNDRCDAVHEAFHIHLERVSAMQVSAVLVAGVDWLAGTRLRPSGAVYWIPGHKIDEFTHLARAIEDAAQAKPSCVYVLRHPLDADGIRAVRDAVIHEVHVDATRIREDVINGGLGMRALETRQRQASELRDKVLLYEELLSVGLESLHEVVDQADQAAATATLMISAGIPELATSSVG